MGGFLRRMVALWASVLIVLCSTGASVVALEPAKGPVILVVSGAIANTNAPGEARFDQAMLERLGLTTVVTETAWTEGQVKFEGVRARDLMAAVGAKGREVLAIALNDYKAPIPMSDFDREDVLLAFRQDGKALRVRDRGPIWIIYPIEPGAAGHSHETRGKMVWQLKELRVK